jgi:hypothetical protein
MGRLIPLLFLVEVALVALALISCLSAEDEEIRTLPRVGWVFVILLFPLVGAIAWFSAGRPVPEAEGAPIRGLLGHRPVLRAGRGEWSRPNRRIVAPDDDPEFLRSLDVERARRDNELFSRWEDDLRRGGTDPRRPSRGPREQERPRDPGRRREPGGTGQDPHPPHDTPQ